MPSTSVEQLPSFIRHLPTAETGIDGVTAHVIRGPVLAVIFEFQQDVHVPEHAHGAQLGYVLKGSLQVRRSGQVFRHQTGDSYLIESQELHEAWVSEGTILIEFFEDADRY